MEGHGADVFQHTMLHALFCTWATRVLFCGTMLMKPETGNPKLEAGRKWLGDNLLKEVERCQSMLC